MPLALPIAYSGPASPPGGDLTHANGDSSRTAPEPTGVQAGCLVSVGLFALGAILVLAWTAVQERGDGRVRLGLLDGVQPGQVVYHATDHVFVVRMADGSPLVLSDLDPHNPPGRDRCRVTFRPDLGGPGEAGRFFDACSGATYDLAGRGLQGDGLDLRSVAVELDADGQLSIAADHAATTGLSLPMFREQLVRGA